MNAQETAQYAAHRERLDRIYEDAAAVREEFRELIARMTSVIAASQGEAA